MRCVKISLGALAATLLAGCATLSVPSRQSIQILAFDALDRPVPNMECRLTNDHGEARARTPAFDVPVQRSGSDLEIECRRGSEVAMGTVAPRRDRMEQAMLPFGSLAVAFDHLTGHLYSYPTVIRLRIGQHLRFEFSTEARAAGLIATVGESTSVDLGAAATPRQPLPAAEAIAVTPVHATAAPLRPAKPAAARPARPSAPAADEQRRSAPLTW